MANRRWSIRNGLAVVLLGAVVAVVPAGPAGAHHGCETFPGTPYMSDPKLEVVEGRNIAACERAMSVLRAEVELYIWSSRTASWVEVAAGDRAVANASYVEAYATSACGGLGDDVKYRTRGHATGVWDAGYTDQDGWAWSTYYRVFDCSHPLQVIHP